MLQHVSNTFHGRDVFAPAAAHLANGLSPVDFGPEIREAAESGFSKVTFSKGNLVGEVLHIDGFGNIITNLSEQDLSLLHVQESIMVNLPNYVARLRLGKTYAEAKPAEALILLGSHGYVEIAVNQGNAAERIKVKAGDKIRLSSTTK